MPVLSHTASRAPVSLARPLASCPQRMRCASKSSERRLLKSPTLGRRARRAVYAAGEGVEQE
eukprot:CAMPEP_0183336882 /NCGR_PEP_ID=MMETSP0164_2-20130417/4726_1 /TAXON_ID=221442 /ORGANISM="Coccolithus pelagicus ssp braarudi, Strain PLY182g" /LENGTH=61 /DNA_ID=CAMNT_0025506493 /DNA_START=354 /DNA_END=539 /DNA_ORIENTATION=-